MNERQESQERAQARERLQTREAQESTARAQARERVRAAQERERQERQQRAIAFRTRAESRAIAARATPTQDAAASPLADSGDRASVRRDAATDPADTMAKESVMSVQDVIDLFNHPLGDGEMRRALQALEADAAWSYVPDEDQADRLTCVLVHQPSGARVNVAQERSLVGIWNSLI